MIFTGARDFVNARSLAFRSKNISYSEAEMIFQKGDITMKGLRNYFRKAMTCGDFRKFYGIGMIIGFFYGYYGGTIREWVTDKIERFHHFMHRNDPIDIHR